MLNKIIRIGSGFDWFSPLLASLTDAANGDPFRVSIPRDVGLTSHQISNALQEKGIKVWGVIEIDDYIGLTVRQRQAHYTLYWLNQWNVPLLGHSPLPEKTGLNSEHTPYDGQEDPTDRLESTAPRRSLLTTAFDMIYSVTDRL